MQTTCGFYIINKDKKMLICHPTKHPDTVWSIPKGIKDKGEDEFSAAKRELHEETNLHFETLESEEKIKLVVNFPKFSDPKWRKGKKELYSNLLICNTDFSEYEMKCTSFVNDDLTFPEIDEFRWVDVSEADKYLHYTQLSNLDNIIKIVNEHFSK